MFKVCAYYSLNNHKMTHHSYDKLSFALFFFYHFVLLFVVTPVMSLVGCIKILFKISNSYKNDEHHPRQNNNYLFSDLNRSHTIWMQFIVCDRLLIWSSRMVLLRLLFVFFIYNTICLSVNIAERLHLRAISIPKLDFFLFDHNKIRHFVKRYQ